MANLYKKALINRDPATGKCTPYKTDKWWGRYRDAHGVTKRIPLSENKQIAQRMLGEISQQVELEKSGLLVKTQSNVKRSIREHIDQFEEHLNAKNSTPIHIRRTIQRISSMTDHCGWKRITEIDATSVQRYLNSIRHTDGLSIATCNHYLRAIKMFVHWLVALDRLVKSPLKIVKTQNEKIDPRHQRRALSQEEFDRLVEAARHGGPAMGLAGSDRAMLYILATWTGFRRGELGSLTLRSFDLTSNPPTVRIEAAYSKRRRQDVQVLHGDLVDYFLKWVTEKRFVMPDLNLLQAFTRLQNRSQTADEILFPIASTSGGTDRNTSKMIKFDLETARCKWIAEAQGNEEREIREQSDFLAYRNAEGKFADFHGLRHTFISNLCRAGVSPKTAQVLARHSTMELTMNVYTHIDQATQVAAINSLPGLKK